jgi:thiosulfate/3-mercaptopyruvate sulfurtransferase
MAVVGGRLCLVMVSHLLTRRRFLLRALALPAAVPATRLLDQPTRPVIAAAQPAFPAHGQPPYLVEPSLVRPLQERHSASMVLLDLSPLRPYRGKHIAGAYHAWWQDTMEVNFPVYGTVLRPEAPGAQERRRQLLHNLGITDSSFVIAYDNDRNRWAARMVWFLRFLGHDRTAVLDGGLAGWLDAGGDVARGGSPNPPSDIPQPTINPRDGYYIWTAQLQQLLGARGLVLVDLRTDGEARDTVNGQLPLGRIPGAISIPWTSATRDGPGHLKSIDDLEALFVDKGVTRDQQVIVYARFGVEAAYGWWLLKLLAYPNVVIYDWGWAGWSTTPGLPIAPLGSP